MRVKGLISVIDAFLHYYHRLYRTLSDLQKAARPL